MYIKYSKFYLIFQIKKKKTQFWHIIFPLGNMKKHKSAILEESHRNQANQIAQGHRDVKVNTNKRR